MRQNIKKVYAAWKAGKSCDMKSISTNGYSIFSYATTIVHKSDDVVYFNETKYSPTTSCQQGALRYLLAMDKIEYVAVDNLPRGVWPSTLAYHAKGVQV